jgi:hypothetical protein
MKIMFILIIVAICICKGYVFADLISLQLITSYNSPGPEWTGSIVYPLHVTGPGGPSFAIVWNKAGGLSLCHFYDIHMNYLDQFYTSTAHEGEFKGTFDYEKIMNVTSGDIDGDGVNEIAIIARQRDLGVYLMRWDSTGKKIEPIWRYQGPPTTFQRALAIGFFSPNEGGTLAFGNDGGDLFLLDKDKQLITTAYLNGKTVQNIRPANTDGDDLDEMYIATGRNPGEVWKVVYENDQLETKWHVSVTQDSGTGDNCYEIWPHPNGNPEGGWGIGGATEQEEGTIMGSMFVMDINGNIKWQEVHPQDAPRAGGAHFADVNGDGIPELITRARGGPVDSIILIRNVYGQVLCKQAVEGPISTSGPYFVDLMGDGIWEIMNTGNPVRVYQINYVSSVKTDSYSRPITYSLAQNYPNPFNQSTLIRYQLHKAGHVRLDVVNLAGVEVKTLVNAKQPVGEHQIRFNAKELASGVYLYRLQVNGFTQTKKLIILR